MRLWHKDLLSVLPDQQLKGQWRECISISGMIAKNGTPNMSIVNRIMEYPIEHFVVYMTLVQEEMWKRGFITHQDTEDRFYENLEKAGFSAEGVVRRYLRDHPKRIFGKWMNDRYYKQCYYNLQEKYDCKALKEEEWNKIFDHARTIKSIDVER